MKIILLLITVLFSSMAVTSCTNDEADTDLDFLNPGDEEEIALLNAPQEHQD